MFIMFIMSADIFNKVKDNVLCHSSAISKLVALEYDILLLLTQLNISNYYHPKQTKLSIFSSKTLQLLRKAKLKFVVEIQIIMSSAKLILARVAVFLEFQHHQPPTKSQRIISKVFLIGF